MKINKALFSLSIIIFFGSTRGISGAVFIYPVLESGGNCIQDLIPERWSVLDSSQGDLNEDSLADIVLIFEFEDSVQSISNDEYRPDTSFYKPRILAIYFRDGTSGKYIFSERSNSFIISSIHRNMLEPFQDMEIQSGALMLDFISMWSMGSWWMSSAEYTFRYQNGQFLLVACVYKNLHRASFESATYNIDFIKEEYTITRVTPNMDGFSETIEYKKITYPEIKSLRSLIKPFFWEFEEGIII